MFGRGCARFASAGAGGPTASAATSNTPTTPRITRRLPSPRPHTAPERRGQGRSGAA